MQADVQKRGWVGVFAGVIDEQPPAGRLSVPKRASDGQHTPTSDRRGWAVRHEREQRGRSP